MNSLDFSIHDIAIDTDGNEYVAKKMIDSDDIIWWRMEKEGSGFRRLFSGAIREAIIKDYNQEQIESKN